MVPFFETVNHKNQLQNRSPLRKTFESNSNQKTARNLCNRSLDGSQHHRCLSLSLLSGDTADLNNWIEIALWITSIAGVLSMSKWGIAFAIFTLSLHVKHQHGYSDLLSNLDKRPKSRRKHTNHHLPLQRTLRGKFK